MTQPTEKTKANPRERAGGHDSLGKVKKEKYEQAIDHACQVGANKKAGRNARVSAGETRARGWEEDRHGGRIVMRLPAIHVTPDRARRGRLRRGPSGIATPPNRHRGACPRSAPRRAWRARWPGSIRPAASDRGWGYSATCRRAPASGRGPGCDRWPEPWRSDRPADPRLFGGVRCS